jgi:hypothetical protein
MLELFEKKNAENFPAGLTGSEHMQGVGHFAANIFRHNIPSPIILQKILNP